MIVFLLALMMAVPGVFVFALVNDRTQRAQGVTEEISRTRGGAQRLLGVLVVAPYTLPAEGDQPARGGWYVVSPERGDVRVTLNTQSLHRGIFEVPVFDANAVTINAHFAPRPTGANLPAGAVVDWSSARIVTGFSDLRGAQSDVTGVLRPAGAAASNVTFAPEQIDLGQVRPGDGSTPYTASPPGLAFGTISTPGAAFIERGGDITVTLALRGADRLSVMPFAKTTSVRMAGNWPSPSFDGGYPAAHRQVTGNGFSVDWTVPFIARGMADHGAASELSLAGFAARDVGVSLVRSTDPYNSVMRALKYAVMFVGLVFLTFFVFEALSGQRLHPAQYILIGLAQMVFYLLLLSLSEWIGFDFAFAAAATATVGLIGLYAGWAFRSTAYQLQALGIFTAVYGLIYLLMRLEDFALLAGSLAAFIGLALAMWLTRRLDWYGGRVDDKPTVTPST
jgi:inner membrane protein